MGRAFDLFPRFLIRIDLSGDKEEIEAKTNALTELSGKLAERVYAQKSASEEHESGAHASSEHADDGVVDAEFEEVKDDDKK